MEAEQFQYSNPYITIYQAQALLQLKCRTDLLATLKRAKIECSKQLQAYTQNNGLQTRRWIYKVNRLQLLSYLARYEEVVYERKRIHYRGNMKRARGVV
jgi:hypothetical protein